MHSGLPKVLHYPELPRNSNIPKLPMNSNIPRFEATTAQFLSPHQRRKKGVGEQDANMDFDIYSGKKPLLEFSNF